MEVITAVVAWSISAACRNVPASSWLGTIRHQGAEAEELFQRLSSKAQVYFPESGGSAAATARWSVVSTPEVNMVVVPGVENDVAATVKYANQKKRPFLAVSSGHGVITRVGQMRDGIEIWMNQLNGVDIAEN
ncbi:hypothetical protein DL768_010321 [Monosporascus sp. mg162]|nr:hypothetical protein DL768_010321 [Monosporascus sp. mg162]